VTGPTGPTGATGSTGKGGLIGGGYLAVNIPAAGFYYTPIGHISSATEPPVRVLVPAGSVSTLHVYYQPAAHAQTVAVTLIKNGAVTALTCTVLANANNCSDLNLAHAVSTVDGDALSVRAVPSAAGAPTTFSFTMLFSAN
jgi:hypothetical protein